MVKPILIIGSDGLIGKTLFGYFLLHGVDVIGTTRRQHTISNTRSFLELTSDLTRWKPVRIPFVTYFCTGTPTIRYCEDFPVLSRIINVNSVVTLAKRLAAQSSNIIFLSSNMVFDGTVPYRKKNNPTCPLNEYGRQRVDVERQLLALGKPVAILRSTKILSSPMPLYSEWIVELKQGKRIHPFADKPVSPLPLHYVIEVLDFISRENISGILQISGERDITYADIAYRIAKRLGVSPDLVQPVTMQEAKIDTSKEFRFTTLEVSSELNESGLKPPSVQDTVDWMINQHLTLIPQHIA